MKTTITDETIAVLWSPHQQQFHIETFGAMIKTNAGICTSKRKGGDYILICLVDTDAQANEVIGRLETAQRTLEIARN